MTGKRKRYEADFKAKVALEALRGEWTTAQLATKHGVHQTMIGEWKRQAATVPHPEHRNYPYLLRNLIVDRPNQAWCADITHIPIRRGFDGRPGSLDGQRVDRAAVGNSAARAPYPRPLA